MTVAAMGSRIENDLNMVELPLHQRRNPMARHMLRAQIEARLRRLLDDQLTPDFFRQDRDDAAANEAWLEMMGIAAPEEMNDHA